MSNLIKLIPTGNTPEKIETSIRAFNQPLADLLTHIGLPTENVLTPIVERRKVICAIESVLEILPFEERNKAFYLSKFTVAITAGLFDGALNFLWDETIKALRRLATTYDLTYFFTVAESLSNRYKNLTKEEDVEAISDYDLLEICRRIGLVNDLNFSRLEHVNYLRNHASAAHPNENEITGHEMISLLENCLRYAITAAPDHSVIQLKLLFENLRSKKIQDEDFSVIGNDLTKQPQERIDDFIQSVFGIYCDPRQETQTKENIEKLSGHLWLLTSEDIKYRIGSKFGVFRKNGDNDRRELAQKFLEVVDGLRYKDEDSLAAELIDKLQDLRTAHFSSNNFYNEYPHAEAISASLPKSKIPKAVKRIFVKTICLCYVGNGLGYFEGVDKRALPYYVDFIKLFGVEEIKEFIDLLFDPEFVSNFDTTKGDKRVRDLASQFKGVTDNTHINRVLDLIIQFPNKAIPKISGDIRFKEAIKFIK